LWDAHRVQDYNEVEKPEQVTIATIVKPQGNRGEVSALLLTDFPERFERLGKVLLQKEGAPDLTLHLISHWFHKGRVILEFSEIENISSADRLRGYDLVVSPDQLVPLPEGSFYHFDLVGCMVKDGSGLEYGIVQEVIENGAQRLLKVRREDGEFLIPFVEPFFVRIDVQQKEMICQLPEGLTSL
jgi:16S rRNA processing protein RimM